MTSFSGTDQGLVRSENEDSFLLHIPDHNEVSLKKGVLAIVADGVGGGPNGKLASSMAVEIVRDRYYNSGDEDNLYSLLMAVKHANNEIFLASKKKLSDNCMATTCTALALIDCDGFLCHAGDSRAYLLHHSNIMRISKDHTLVEEMVDDDIITAEEARIHPQRNIILKALGTKNDIEPDIKSFHFDKGDTILLCSDGLHGCVTDDEITGTLLADNIATAGQKLIELALTRGGPDNVTLVILNI
jgi:PPM family protein phosphatase